MPRAVLRVVVALAAAVLINGGLALAMALWADLGREPKPPRPARAAVEIPLVRAQPQKKQTAERKAGPRQTEAARPAMPALDLPSAITVPVFDPGALRTAAVVHPAQEKKALILGGDTILTEDMLDEPPRPLIKAPLRYPKEAETKGVEGEVEARLLLDTDGSVLQVRVLSATPPGVFEGAAQESLSTWRFSPATFRGQKLKAWVRQRVVFTLH